MDEKIIEEINFYLNSEDIEPSSDYISVNDLWDALLWKFNGLRGTVRNINDNKTCLKIEDVGYCNDAYWARVRINDGYDNNYVGVRREKGTTGFAHADFIYLSVKKVLEEIREYIDKIFDEMEKCEELIKCSDKVLFLSNDLLECSMSYDNLGEVQMSILKLHSGLGVNLQLLLMKIVTEYLDLSGKTIDSVKSNIYNNILELFKKIPVDISSLSDEYQKIVYEYLNNKRLVLK